TIKHATPTGVYFLVDGGEIVYVGGSTNVTARIYGHVSEDVKQFDRAFWIETSRDDLLAYEGAFIRLLAPKYCLASPADTGRDEEVLAVLGMRPNADARNRHLKRRSEIRAARKLAWKDIKHLDGEERRQAVRDITDA